MSGSPRPGALRSPIGRMILIGQAAVAQAVAGKPCPLDCGYPPGEHAAGCLVGEAIVHDPLIAAQVQAAKEGTRG